MSQGNTPTRKRRLSFLSPPPAATAPIQSPGSPVKIRRLEAITTKQALQQTGRSNPCVCGCTLNCSSNYIVPFKPNTNGRIRMLRLFGLHNILTDESFWRLVATERPRLSLFHFTSAQLDCQTKGKSSKKAYTRLKVPQCWDETLLVRRDDIKDLVSSAESNHLGAGVPSLNTRSLEKLTLNAEDASTSSEREQLVFYKRLAAKQEAEAMEFKRQANEAKRELESRVATLEGLLRGVETEREAFFRELTEHHRNSPHAVLCLQTLKEDKFFRQNIRRLTSCYTVEEFEAFLDLINVGDCMANINPHNTYKRILQLGSSSERELQMPEPLSDDTPVKQSLSWQDSILCVLVHNRVGFDTADLYTFFGVSYSTLRKHYIVYQQALRFFLITEQPYPGIDRILASTPPKLKQVYKTLESIIDDHEQKVETGSSLPVANTFWSQYKHYHSLKLFGAVTPSGFGLALDTVGRSLDESEPRPGRCNDVDMVEQVAWPERVTPGYTSLADKGILAHAQFAAVNHTLLTPFKKRRKVPGFCENEQLMMVSTAPVRIHVERFFERVQDFKVLRKVIKVSEIDIFASIWSICYHMSNYDADLLRQ